MREGQHGTIPSWPYAPGVALDFVVGAGEERGLLSVVLVDSRREPAAVALRFDRWPAALLLQPVPHDQADKEQTPSPPAPPPDPPWRPTPGDPRPPRKWPWRRLIVDVELVPSGTWFVDGDVFVRRALELVLAGESRAYINGQTLSEWGGDRDLRWE